MRPSRVGSGGSCSEGPTLGLMNFLAAVHQGVRVFILQTVQVALSHPPLGSSPLEAIWGLWTL